jgi:recombination protein RecA
MGDSFVGIQARLMSQALRKLTGAVSRSNTALVFTNQLREKIGVMFGNPETTPGGRALKFYASVRLDIRRIETIKTGTESVGNRVRVKVVKNKVAPPFRVAEFDVMYGEGVSKEGGLLDVGVAMDVVNKTGAWFTFEETRLGQGREAAKEFLKGNEPIAMEIERRIRGKLIDVTIPVEGIEEAEERARSPTNAGSLDSIWFGGSRLLSGASGRRPSRIPRSSSKPPRGFSRCARAPWTRFDAA